jgi:hypothetical protein
MGLKILFIGRRRPPVDPTGRALVEILPAIEQKLRVQAPLEVPKPVSLVPFCLVNYSPRGEVGLC